MKTIKISFKDFYQMWDENNNYIIRALRKYYSVEFSDKPDYLFFSCFGDENLNYDCIKIFCSGEDITPDFNLCDYGISFDCLNYGDRYLRFPNFIHGEKLEKAFKARKNIDIEKSVNRDFCSFVVSNGGANPVREEFFKKLSQYKQVASGGKLLNNVGGPVEDKIAFQSDYKFCIAFENDSSDGYTSEKIVDAFLSGSVPIYWGNRKISEDFNSGCFINCHDFSSLDEVVDYVIEVDNNPDLYKKIISAPLFKDNVIPEKFTSLALEKFLCSIIDKPLDEAKRISRYSRKSDYLSTQKEKAEYFHRMHHSFIYKALNKLS